MATAGEVRELEFRILGPLEVAAEGEQLALGGQKQKELLALFVVNAPKVVSTDRLVHDLWGDSPPPTALETIQVYVSRLRKLLEPTRRRGDEPRLLVSHAPGYALDLAPEQRDVDRFERLCRDARAAYAAGRPDDAVAILDRALGHWRGPPLAEFGFADWAQSEIARLEEARLACVEDRIEAVLACGRHREVIPEIEAVVARHPLRERLWELLLTALYRSGRQADALDAYQRLRERLVEELGIDPKPELQELYRSILNQDETLAAPALADRRPRSAVTLPSAANPLIGREREVGELCSLLTSDATRLVTITGPGGVGKTRLSLGVATEIAQSGHGSGVVWVGLQSLREPSLVLSTIAQALEVEGDVAEAIADQDLLVCLDNFEQVVAAGASVAELLAACPRLRLLVTSRELLRVSGEQEYPLAPLGGLDAVALFSARARAVEPGFEVDADVEAICRRVDNLPLAIELAAARVKLLTTRQLRERLERRLPVLGDGPRDVPERQRTLTAAIAWSHELLVPDEQALFRRLSVFAGGCTLEAAEDVVGAELDLVQSLLDKSLLRRSGDRYWMLETIREYAHGLLESSDDADATRRAHAEWCLGLTAGPDGAGSFDSDSLELLARERDNCRAALSWAMESDRPVVALELAVGLEELWETRGPLAEGSAWLVRALDAAPDAPRELRARALHDATSLAARQGDHDAMAGLATTQLSLAQESGDQLDVVRALVMLATVAGYRGDEDDAFARSEEAVTLALESGDARSQLTALNCRGVLELGRGEYATAKQLFERCLELARTAGRRPDSVATAEFNVGLASVLSGEALEAAEHVAESLRLYRDLRHFDGIGYCFVVLGALAAGRQDLGEATRTLGAAEILLATVGAALEPPEQALYDRTVDDLRAALPTELFESEWSQGQGLAEAELAAGAGSEPA